MPGEGEQDNKVQGPLKPYFSGGGEESLASYANTDVAVGSEVGPFKVLVILGEGGYGIVYLAEQERPIRRRVALKVLKPGMDSKQVIARFEAERQALAFLDHPNIAQIHDAGTTPQGRPYFAMELIEGRTITEYCDRERLSLRERLRLFLQVCSAVRHAHQKGILHRDLKPSNVLVATQDGEPLVKVIDFGIAKALAQPLTDRTLHTEQGQFIGTPDYMSPEQAEMDARGVDTRSDVYSLGVILYELLTGVLPFDPDTLRNGGSQNLRRTICQQEPKTPSTRLTALGEGIAAIAERRQTDPQTLARSLRRELEWIPLKAMRKEAPRRYQSVSDLGHDIENYLRGNPLLAGPESMAYLATKFVQRHRGAVAATLTVAASLLIALIVSTTMYATAEKMRAVADQSRQSAEKAQAAEETQRQAAEQERDRAVKAEHESVRRLAGLYRQQGRQYLDTGDLDRALVLLAEALKNDGGELSTLLLAQECLRTHPDPNINTFTSLVRWKGQLPGAGPSFATSPDRKLIAFADEEGPAVEIFDTESAEPVIELQTGKVSKLAFLPGGRHLLARVEGDNSHHSIRVFDLNTGVQVTSIPRANADVDILMRCPHGQLPPRDVISKFYERILLSPSGDWFAFLDADPSGDAPESWVVVWDFSNRDLHHSNRMPCESLLTGICFRPISSYGHPSALVAIDCRQLCHLWDVPQFTLQEPFEFPAIGAIVGGTRMIVHKPTGEVELLDRAGNRTILTVPHATAFGFSPDYARVVTTRLSESDRDTADVTKSTIAELWDAQWGTPVVHLGDPGVENWHFSPDGRFLLTERHDGEIQVWFSDNGRLAFTISPDTGQQVADISPDGVWLATCDRQGTSAIGIWNLVTGERFRPYCDDVSGDEISSAWLLQDTDDVFADSRRPPTVYPRFNGSGSALICAGGLLPFRSEAVQAEYITKLVSAYVDLRIDAGHIREASYEEEWTARLDFLRHTNRETSAEALACLLNVASWSLDNGYLARAFELYQEYEMLSKTADPDLTKMSTDLALRLCDAHFRKGDSEERCGRHDLAITRYRSALALRVESPEILRRLAWVLATRHDRSPGDVGEALTLAERACLLTEWRSSECLHTYAVACAANARFAEAVRMQQRAIDLLPLAEQERWMANQRTFLRLFEAGGTYDWVHFRNLPERNLVCWWAPDDLDGAVIRDRSGLGHDASFVGDVRTLHDERYTALQFQEPESCLLCPNTPDLNITDALTVAAWVQYASEDDAKQMNQQVAGKGHAWRLYVASATGTAGFACAGLTVPASAPDSRVIGRVSLNDGRWHHLVGVYDSRTLSLYVDGALDVSADASGSLLVSEQGITLSQGVWYYSHWRGLIREGRIYNRALSKEEIAQLYKAGE